MAIRDRDSDWVVQYKTFKKMLKRRVMASATNPDSPRSASAAAVAAEKSFLRLLRCQLKDIDRHGPVARPKANAVLHRHSLL